MALQHLLQKQVAVEHSLMPFGALRVPLVAQAGELQGLLQAHVTQYECCYPHPCISCAALSL